MTDQQKLEGKVATDTVVTPGPGAINWRDIGWSLIYAMAASVIPLLMQMVNSWTFDPKALLQTALSTFLGVLAVKFFRPTQQVTTFKKQ